MGKLSTKPLAILSAILIGGGIFAASTGIFNIEVDTASAINNSDLYGSGSGSTTTTTPTTGGATTIPNTSTGTVETPPAPITNPDTADEDWIMIVVALGVAGLAFSCRQYFARH